MNPETLLAIDPGTKAIGLACFRSGRLVYCTLVRAKDLCDLLATMRELRGQFPGVDETVIEIPQVYGAGKGKGDPNDLIRVAVAAGGAAVAGGGIVRLVQPRAWKGQVPKEVHNQRVIAKLDRLELSTLQGCDAPRSLAHNVIDAVGLGLWRLGR